MMSTRNYTFLSKWVLENNTNKKTPTYVLKNWFGSSPILEQIGRNGRRYFYYKPNCSKKPESPAINIQGIGGLNITGLRWLIENGWKYKESVAYGEACLQESLSNGKANYMYPHRADALLFKFGEFVPYKNAQNECLFYVPSVIYLIVIRKARMLAKEYCKMLSEGFFDEDIKLLSETKETRKDENLFCTI